MKKETGTLKSWLVVLAALALAAAFANHASAQQSSIAGERAVGLLVDFVAVRTDGTPVADLQPSDVEVRLNGRVRKVRVVHRVATAPAPVTTGAAVGVAPPYGTNDAVAAGRTFLLVIDEGSFVAGREKQLRSAVDGLLGEMTPADRTMVVALPYGGIKVPLTSDRARIRIAMMKLAGQGSRDETGSGMARRTRTFLDSLDAFLRPHAGRTTPLTVVLFTAGLAAPRRDAPMTLAPGQGELRTDDFQRVAVTAGAARASFYLLEPADIAMSVAGWRETIAGADFLGSDNPLEGIEHLAGATGAARLPLDATGTASLLRVARETSTYYVAEVEPEKGEIYGRSRPVTVRVTRPGITVRIRPQITFVEPARRAKTTRLAVTSMLSSSDAFGELRLRAAGFTVREADGRLRVGVVVETLDEGVSLVSLGAVLLDGTGQIVANWYASDAAKHPLLGAMAAAPGTYRLRVAAIDAAGRAGVAEDDVEAHLATVGPLSLGSLILGVSRDGAVVPRLEFGAEPSAIASFDIYGGAAGMRLSATLDLARDVDGPPITVLPLALSRASNDRVVATATLPLGALAPGDYVVRGVIQLDDGTTARVVRTLRKAPARPSPPSLLD